MYFAISRHCAGDPFAQLGGITCAFRGWEQEIEQLLEFSISGNGTVKHGDGSSPLQSSFWEPAVPFARIRECKNK